MSNMNAFYYEILNIGKKEKNNIDIIKNVVSKYKNNIKDTEALCKVLSNNISFDLEELGISNKVLNTYQLLESYEHEFVIAYYKFDNQIRYILIDPTYEQFIKRGNDLNKRLAEWPASVLAKTNGGLAILREILSKGFMEVDNSLFKLYLGSFINTINEIGIDVELEDIMLKKYKYM